MVVHLATEETMLASVQLRLGPADHGLRLSSDDFDDADFEPGARYEILDGRENPNEPALIQHRRRGKRWVIRSFPYGSTFSTKLLPGFELVIDPRK